ARWVGSCSNVARNGDSRFCSRSNSGPPRRSTCTFPSYARIHGWQKIIKCRNSSSSARKPILFEFPVRYAHEDGSDGVVRVSASNLNFNYLEIGPKTDAAVLPWPAIQTAVQSAAAKADFAEYYEVKSTCYAG